MKDTMVILGLLLVTFAAHGQTLEVEQRGDGYELSWSSVSNAQNYRVLRAEPPADGESGPIVLDETTTELSYLDTDELEVDELYYYRICARGSLGITVSCSDRHYFTHEAAAGNGLCAEQWCKEVRIRWLNPTEREDGSDFSPDEIANTGIYWSDDLSRVEEMSSDMVLVPGPDEELVMELPAGTWYIGANTTDLEGLISDLSEIIDHVVTPRPDGPVVDDIWSPEPDPATRLVVGEENGVYVPFQSLNRIARAWVGTVPVGTLCDPTQGFNGMYVVPIEEADIVDGNPEVVVAQCLAE